MALHFLQIFLFIFLFLFGMHASWIEGAGAKIMQCIEAERNALLKVKYEFIDDYGILSSWRETETDCCKWKGIHCHNSTSHIIKLDLHGTSSSHTQKWTPLKGNISSSLVTLQHLKYLDLSLNHFSPQNFPEFIGALVNLEYLNLSHLNFEGQVSPQIGNLTKLEFLDLNNIGNYPSMNLEILSHFHTLSYLNLNTINLSKSKNWIQILQTLPLLEELHMSLCFLPDVSPSPLQLLVGNFSRFLSVVDLSANGLPSSSTFPWLFNLSHSLTSIDLSLNFLDSPIPNDFINITNLSHLVMHGSHLFGEIPRDFGKFKHLEVLDLADNELSGPISNFMEDLSRNSGNTLKDLNLVSNKLSGSLHISNFSSLENLLMRYNKLDNVLVQGEIPNLLTIDLSFNQLVGSIPDFGLQSPSLKLIELQNNKLIGFIPESIWQLSNLEHLALNNNNLRGVISEFDLSNVPNLNSLYLAFCTNLVINVSNDWIPPFQLEYVTLASVQLGPSFPNWLKNQHHIEFLFMAGCGIVDSVPSWFWDTSPSFWYLNISGNQMSGALPDTSSRFLPPNNKFLDLSKNKLFGSAEFLCNTTYDLEYLDLSDNSISGTLPDCLRTFSNIKFFNLANNNFSGRIQRTIENMVDMEVLILRDNSLTGEFPDFLRKFSRLIICDISGNQFFGRIPSNIGLMWSNMVFLSFRSNAFSGDIPLSFCQLENVQVLDLSQNKMSGTIPNCLNNLTRMIQENNGSGLKIITDIIGHHENSASIIWKGIPSMFKSTLGLIRFIDLSSNDLSGEIPPQITELKSLVALNISRNKLVGFIPPNIGKMEALDFLDVSRNMLSGQIPMSLASIDYLGFLDLSFNNLSGRIPTTNNNKLQTFNASAYVSNSQLCGFPLKNDCPGDEMTENPEFINNGSFVDDKWDSLGLYISIVLGFTAGFWAVCGSLLVNRSWRYAYFEFLSNIINWIYVKVAQKTTRI